MLLTIIFFADVRRAEKIAELIRKESIKKSYYIYSRADTVVKYPDLFEKWAHIGLKRVFIGFESLRNIDLNDYNKNCTVEMNDEAIEILHRLKIEIYASFIVRQEWTAEDFDALYNYIEKKSLFLVEIGILTPFPGTLLYEEQEKNFITHDYDLFDLAHSILPTKLPLEEFYRQFINLQKRCYSFERCWDYIEKNYFAKLPLSKHYMFILRRIFQRPLRKGLGKKFSNIERKYFQDLTF